MGDPKTSCPSCSFKKRVYPGCSYTAGEISGQIKRCPDVRFIVDFDRQIVTHCVTLIISGSIAFRPLRGAKIIG
jgi:hypothetical protein